MKNKNIFLSLLLFCATSCGNVNTPEESNNNASNSSKEDIPSVSEEDSLGSEEISSSGEESNNSESESISESNNSESEESDLESASEEDPSESESTSEVTVSWPNEEALNKEVEVSTISEVIDICYSLPIKDNGSTYSTNAVNNKRTFDFYENVEPTKVKFVGQYLDKSEAKNPVFYDGEDVIQVYCIDNNKVENLLDTDSAIGNTYEVTGFATMYKNKPSILVIKTYEEELISPSFVLKEYASEANTPSYDSSKLIDTTVADLIKNSPKYLSTKDEYRNIYHFEGYLSSYIYGSNEYIMMVDNLTDCCDPFSTSAFKAVRVNNYDSASYSYLYDYLDNKEKVSFDFYIFQWMNVNKKAIYEIEVIVSSIN